MPTPSKPYVVLKGEKRSHRTKAELNMRKQGEMALSSSEEIKEKEEVRGNPVAHKEYLRVSRLLKNIEKNDAFYEPVINRYCLIQAECVELDERKALLYELMDGIKQGLKAIPNEERVDRVVELTEIANSLAKLANQLGVCDRILQQKRKMLLDIEKENIMTIASTLRSVPKKAETKENPLLEALKG